MKTFHAQRLMKLARFIHALPENKFGFASLVKGKDKPRKELDCGSTACAIGWCPILWPKEVEYVNGARFGEDYAVLPKNADPQSVYDCIGATAEHLFALDADEASALFHPYSQSGFPELTRLTGSASSKSVAQNIAMFVSKRSPNIDTSL